MTLRCCLGAAVNFLLYPKEVKRQRWSIDDLLDDSLEFRKLIGTEFLGQPVLDRLEGRVEIGDQLSSLARDRTLSISIQLQPTFVFESRPLRRRGADRTKNAMKRLGVEALGSRAAERIQGPALIERNVERSQRLVVGALNSPASANEPHQHGPGGDQVGKMLADLSASGTHLDCLGSGLFGRRSGPTLNQNEAGHDQGHADDLRLREGPEQEAVSLRPEDLEREAREPVDAQPGGE